MKVTKNAKPVKAGETICIDTDMAAVSPYQCAVDNIMNAIECLGTLAQSGDEVARESITNLSVVLLDLK